MYAAVDLAVGQWDGKISFMTNTGVKKGSLSSLLFDLVIVGIMKEVERSKREIKWSFIRHIKDLDDNCLLSYKV